MTVFPAYCEVCQATRRFERPGINHVLHLLITVLTCGWWAIVWLFLAVFGGGKAHCIACGNPKGVGSLAKILGTVSLVALAVVMFSGSLGALSKIRDKGETSEVARTVQTITPTREEAMTPPPSLQKSPLGPPPLSVEAQMGESKKRAIAKYPALAQAGSPMNSRFVAAYNRLRALKSPRLSEPNWFEKLADEVATP